MKTVIMKTVMMKTVMMKSIICIICQVFLLPVILHASVPSTSESAIQIPLILESPDKNDWLFFYEYDPGIKSISEENQSIMMAPPLPGDVGGEIELPVGGSWIEVFILVCIYITIKINFKKKFSYKRKT